MSLIAAASLLLLAPIAPAGADDSYTPDVPTGCQVSVPSAVVGERVVLEVVVSASSNVDPTGTVEVTVSRAASVARAARSVGPTPWTKTVRYEGSPIRVVGPRLSRGDHVASIRFRPDSDVFEGCRDSVRFQVGARGGAGEAGGSDAVLPDTGGPHLLLLLTGAGFVTAGVGLVGGSRRQRRDA